MYAGISTACPYNIYGSSEVGAQDFLNHLLHRDRIRLNLPSVIVFSVVGYIKKVAQFLYF